MSVLTALNLTKPQMGRFKKAYSEGAVHTEVIGNLMNAEPEPRPSRRLELLPVPDLDPVHFHFTGNRSYCMQVVGNGAVYGVLSHERSSKRQRQNSLMYNTVRLEVVTGAALPFMKVATPPSPAEVRALYADFLNWLVEGNRRLVPMLESAGVDGQGWFLPRMSAQTPEACALDDQILAGANAVDVLTGWIQGPVSPRPRPR